MQSCVRFVGALEKGRIERIGHVMNQVIMYVLAAGVILGGADRLFGNRLGYGKRLEEGFLFMGPTALSMVGIMCLVPFLSDTLGELIIPVFQFFGIDPAVFGGFLAIDMGGYQLAKSLEYSPLVGSYAGVIVAATFGCTLVFTLPVGMGVIEKEDQPLFAEGLLIGLVTLPLGLILGAILSGLSPFDAVWQNMPVFLLSLFLGIGLKWFPARMIRGLSLFAAGLKAVITIGLVLGAVTYLTGLSLLPNLSPIQDALAVVASIGITMLGSLPAAEFLQRILRRPFAWLGAKVGVNAFSMVGLLVGSVSVLPQLAMMKDMDPLGKRINAAYLVCAASTLAAHVGFTLSAAPSMVSPLLAAKAVGAGSAAILAFLLCRRRTS